jgi:Subtilase family
MADSDYPHLFITDSAEPFAYTNPTGGGKDFALPPRPDRPAHAEKIKNGLIRAWEQARQEADERVAVSTPARSGTYIEFQSAPGFELKFESLEQRGSGIRLLNVRSTTDENGREIQLATIYIPFGKERILANKVDRYLEDARADKKARNTKLIESIEELKTAVLQSFWYDPTALLPDEDQKVWCEVWLRVGDDSDQVIAKFFELCGLLNLETRDTRLSFPEREVVMVKASRDDLTSILNSSDHLAEFRRAKETAAFWAGLPNADQAEWVAQLAAQLSADSESNCFACIIDTGANNGHPLLAPLLEDVDCHTVHQPWGTSDTDGHGTLMGGTVAFGDRLGDLLQSAQPIHLPFRLESSKLIPSSGHRSDGRLYGERTAQAISRAELQRENARRAFCLAITSEDGRDRGRPSSWSGAIDQLAAAIDGGPRRLLIISAGNVADPAEWKDYPNPNLTNTVHDPAQAWNALTVGAITYKDRIEDEDLAFIYSPIARAGELSPYSSTSATWESKWPNKPDIVLEGGNAATDSTNFTTELDDLSLLSLNHNPQDALLKSTAMTSAATGLATEMACRLMAQYPDAWPETIRALLVHSASWPDRLKSQFEVVGNSEKANIERMLRICGYGVPDFNRALESARNSLTLISQETIQPFGPKEPGSKEYKAKDMHLYELPWPAEALAELPDNTPVRIDVTLSYFIEPGPGEIGWRDKYRYRSHGLDFNIKKPTETLNNFKTRINKAARDPDGEDYGGSSVPWAIGPQSGRPRGSIHRDWVELMAIEAQSANVVGVFPRSGWWKERKYLGRASSRARYSIIITLTTPTTEVDIYTPVAVKIAPEIEVPT